MRQQGSADLAAPRRRSAGLRLVLLVIGSLLFAGFFALGTWQVQRLQWKLALIERVNERVHAAPVDAPAVADWPQVSAERDEYRHVRLSGVYALDATARVQASTELGSGFWLLTPMCREDGSVVLVNRGFVAGGAPGAAAHAAPADCAQARAQGAAASVTGLLRISEPNGGVLRDNDPAADRWYSRDVKAIAASRQLSNVAPYFVDADATPGAAADAPIGGLTVVSFHNNHLVYALTWYVLALMVAWACYWIVRRER
ncbi:SURF1 family protein [Pseudoduganella sp. RAF19]|uniref:SURF1 family protein n=2 Tax=unclassified Pseudoduganella TaxID=2637179 RepID=UPI003F995A86